MILKIVGFLLVPFMFIAIYLSANGVSQIPYDNTFYSWLKVTMENFNGWKLSIPPIPKIPILAYQDDSGVLWVIINALIFVVRILTRLVNFIIGVVDVVFWFLNIIIQIVQFLLTCIYSIKDLKDLLTAPTSVSVYGKIPVPFYRLLVLLSYPYQTSS